MIFPEVIFVNRNDPYFFDFKVKNITPRWFTKFRRKTKKKEKKEKLCINIRE